MEPRTYKTRVSILLMIIIILAGVLCISPMILHHASKTAIILNSAFVILVLGITTAGIINIKYVIYNDTLRIYTFFWIHKDIKIDSIRKMEPSRCILSSPAGSLKRLAIHYNKFDVVYISPRYQEDFINEINKRRKCKD